MREPEWAYKIEEWDPTQARGDLPGLPSLEKILKDHGQTGWELTATLPTESQGAVLIFKRPIPTS